MGHTLTKTFYLVLKNLGLRATSAAAGIGSAIDQTCSWFQVSVFRCQEREAQKLKPGTWYQTPETRNLTPETSAGLRRHTPLRGGLKARSSHRAVGPMGRRLGPDSLLNNAGTHIENRTKRNPWTQSRFANSREPEEILQTGSRQIS
jgi:hypothetical protein